MTEVLDQIAEPLLAVQNAPIEVMALPEPTRDPSELFAGHVAYVREHGDAFDAAGPW